MDYAHARHAGNVGDVFKHLALVAILEELLRDPAPLRYVESHAGDGIFPLGSNGEWGAGIQPLWELAGDGDLLGRYVALVRRWSGPGATRPSKYPGSPLIAQALLRPHDALLLHELEPQAAGVLRKALAGDARAEVRETNGFAALAAASAREAPHSVAREAPHSVAREAPHPVAREELHPIAPDAAASGRNFVLVDPPYTQKGEWADAAHAVAQARSPRTSIALWYPIKALTRPRGMLSALVEAGVHGTVVELVSTPLRLKREKLNGSGLIFVNVPDAAVASVCAALVRLGPRVATHGEWSAAQIGF